MQNEANAQPGESLLTEWHTYSLQQCSAYLAQAGIAGEDEINQISQQCLTAWSIGEPAEPLSKLAVLQNEDENHFEATIERWSMMLTSLVAPTMPPAPFASKMMTPSAFYEKHAPLHDLARTFMCPILYNEDADVIGVGSINPVTVTIFSQAAHAYLYEIYKVRPLISCVRLNYESWRALVSKHFP